MRGKHTTDRDNMKTVFHYPNRQHPQYTKGVRVPDDPNNTVLIIHKDADEQEAISKYLRRRGVYLRSRLDATVLPLQNAETR